MKVQLSILKYAFPLSILFLLNTEGFAQTKKHKNPEKQSTEDYGLFLRKSIPLYIYSKSGCDADTLIVEITDSLKKEGFTIIDSTSCLSLSMSFNKKYFTSLMKTKVGSNETVEEVKASMEEDFKAANIYQELQITNYSCLDTLNNYTIQIHIFPKPWTTDKSLNFTLPFSSHAAIKDVILSLISRE